MVGRDRSFPLRCKKRYVCLVQAGVAWLPRMGGGLEGRDRQPRSQTDLHGGPSGPLALSSASQLRVAARVQRKAATMWLGTFASSFV
jgi:hypothetical protein